MNQHIKNILILLPAVLFLNGCGIGAYVKLSILFKGASKIFQQDSETIVQVIFVILIIVVILGLLYYFNKNPEDKKITNKTSDETEENKVEEIKEQPQQKRAGEKIGYWLAKNISNIKNPSDKINKELKGDNRNKESKKILTWDEAQLKKSLSKIPLPRTKQPENNLEPKKTSSAEMRALDSALSKIPKPMSQQKKEEIKKAETQEKKPKEILTWDEPLQSDLKKEEPVKEETKPLGITVTSQEEEVIYAQVAKELKENRKEGIWLKAFTENDGDETKTKIAYTKKRVHELIESLKKNKDKE